MPADRFFQAAPQVRAAVERSVQANALRLAKEKPPLKPFYLVGRLGDRDLSIAASAEGLRVNVGGEEQTIPLKEEGVHERDEAIEAAPAATRAQVAEDAAGAGRDGQAALPAGPVGAVGGARR
ncbi:MAG: hypothetical protein QM767_02595 [Anaeromyxobacter sp.]